MPLITISADTIQFFGHAIVLAQKLAYLYGMARFLDADGTPTKRPSIAWLLLGFNVGSEANRVLTEIAKRFAQEVGHRLPKRL